MIFDGFWLNGDGDERLMNKEEDDSWRRVSLYTWRPLVYSASFMYDEQASVTLTCSSIPVESRRKTCVTAWSEVNDTKDKTVSHHSPGLPASTPDLVWETFATDSVGVTRSGWRSLVWLTHSTIINAVVSGTT